MSTVAYRWLWESTLAAKAKAGKPLPKRKRPPLKSAWYRPLPLTARASDLDIERQEEEYVAWLRKRWRCSQKDAELLVQVQRDEMEAAAPVRAEESRIREETPISDRVSIRAVRTHHTKEHWEFSPHFFWHGQLLADPDAEEDESKSCWRWRRLRKPDAPTVYKVMVDGRCRDSFLSRGLARKCAERIASECSLRT